MKTMKNEPNTSRSNSASLLSIAIVIGAISLSIADAVPGGLDGAWAFVLGLILSFIALAAIHQATVRRIDRPSSPESPEQISDLALALSSMLSKLSKRTGTAEWK